MLLKAYYKRPDATAESINAEGYFMTGDAGYFDEDGHLKIIDRAKDVGKMSDGTMFAPNYIENKLKFFQHVKEAVTFGAGKDFVTAFINIDLEAVGNWAEKKGMAYSGYADLAQQSAVYELIRGCVEKINADLATDPKMSGAQIKRFLVLHKELDADDGELTRTRKVRRNFIAEKYGVLIDAMFEGQEEPVHRDPGQVRRRPHRQGLRRPAHRGSEDLCAAGRPARGLRKRGMNMTDMNPAAVAQPGRRFGDVILDLQNISLRFGGVKR